MDGWMNEQMEGWMIKEILVYFFLSFVHILFIFQQSYKQLLKLLDLSYANFVKTKQAHKQAVVFFP